MESRGPSGKAPASSCWAGPAGGGRSRPHPEPGNPKPEGTVVNHRGRAQRALCPAARRLSKGDFLPSGTWTLQRGSSGNDSPRPELLAGGGNLDLEMQGTLKKVAVVITHAHTSMLIAVITTT